MQTPHHYPMSGGISSSCGSSTGSSTTSFTDTTLHSSGAFVGVPIFYLTYFLPTQNWSSSSSTSTSAIPVARNDQPKMIGTFMSNSQSNTTKSTSNMNLCTLTSMSNSIPTDLLVERSTINSLIRVGLGFPRLNFLKINRASN